MDTKEPSAPIKPGVTSDQVEGAKAVLAQPHRWEIHGLLRTIMYPELQSAIIAPPPTHYRSPEHIAKRLGLQIAGSLP